MLLNNLLIEKKWLLRKINDNKNEVKRLAWMMRDTEDKRQKQAIRREMRQGEVLIDKQIEELKQYTVANMSKKLGVHRNTLFNRIKALNGNTASRQKMILDAVKRPMKEGIL